MVRDDEIQRLVNYIKGIGVKISFSSKKSEDVALWYLDNSGIVIYKAKNTTKIETVLSLIHEIGHSLHCVWENGRKIDTKFEKAILQVNEADSLEIDTKKRDRKIILDSEIAGTRYWHSIYLETGMKFPIWRLELQMEYDVWNYQIFYETGSYPRPKDKKAKKIELHAKYRDRK